MISELYCPLYVGDYNLIQFWESLSTKFFKWNKKGVLNTAQLALAENGVELSIEAIDQ